MNYASAEDADLNIRFADLTGWMLIAAFVAVSALMLFGGAASQLRLAFPIGAFILGIFLYFRYPIVYLVFAWWLWFLTPFFRRLVDYRSEWVDPSPILLAPLLVALIAGCGLFRRESPLEPRERMPFLLAIGGIVYALGTGLIQNPINAVVPTLLNWVVPVFFGFHFLSNWRSYPHMRKATQSCFLWMTLLTGAYGIYQFFTAPGWDALWLSNVDAVSFGRPEPMEIRVFSTLNSPGPFGVVMMAGLLLLFAVKKPLRIPAAVVGYVSFLLCLARTAWLGWLVGLMSLFLTFRSALKFKLLAIVFALLLLIVPLMTIEPFSGIVRSRLDSFGNVGEDASYLDRLTGYEILMGEAVIEVFGKGLGYEGDERVLPMALHDSAVLEMLLTLGWLGTLLYVSGLTVLFLGLLSQSRSDAFVDAARAICFGLLAQILLGNVFIAVSGIIFWSFAGLAMASRRYAEDFIADHEDDL